VDNPDQARASAMLLAVTSRPSRFDPARPFSPAQAAAAGIDRRALRTNAYRRIFHGVYVAASTPMTPRLRARAALVPYPPRAAFLSHASGARMLGAPLPVLPDEHVTVVRPELRRNRAGIVCHYTPRARVLTVDGVSVSAYSRLFVELAGQLSLVELVAVGDYLVQQRWTTPGRLVKTSTEFTGRHARLARAAAGFVRERVESPMETRLRMLIVLAGLPEPVVNASLRLEDGTPVRRYDLSYPQGRLVIEYDGRQHVERVDQWESDLDRREAIDDDGWRILVVTSRGLFVEPGRTLERIARVARLRGVRGVPRVLRDDWRPHFPGR
jgi:uncharacterized protein DUF559